MPDIDITTQTPNGHGFSHPRPSPPRNLLSMGKQLHQHLYELTSARVPQWPQAAEETGPCIRREQGGGGTSDQEFSRAPQESKTDLSEQDEARNLLPDAT